MEEDNRLSEVVVFIIALCLMVWLLAGCCPCRHLTASSQDSVRVEVVERIVEVRDTAYVEVAGDKQVVTTRDTTSFLENDFAYSRASVVRGGLYHELVTKSSRLAFPITIPTLRRDSIVYQGFYRTEVVEVAKPLTWWQQTQIKGFWVMLAIVTILYFIRKMRKKVGLFP
ncbi:MAG: hypothetical protein IKK89_04750 [Alistipes sp.]|nr:hypothetical protein [Alistipes sp.]